MYKIWENKRGNPIYRGYGYNNSQTSGEYRQGKQENKEDGVQDLQNVVEDSGRTRVDRLLRQA